MQHQFAMATLAALAFSDAASAFQIRIPVTLAMSLNEMAGIARLHISSLPRLGNAATKVGLLACTGTGSRSMANLREYRESLPKAGMRKNGRGVISCNASEEGGAGGEESEGIKYDKPLNEMTLEEIEALPPMPEFTGSAGGEDVEVLENIMIEDRRFGYKVKALQGEFDKEGDDETSENLAETLMPFPGPCTFKIVARRQTEDEAGVEAALIALMERVEGIIVLKHSSQERLGGKFVSVEVEARVETAKARAAACKMLLADARVKMAF